MRVDVITLIILPFICVFGAYFSKQLKTTQNNLYMYLIPITSILTGLVWAFLSKYTRWPLSITTIIFDTLMSISYFLYFIFAGESITIIQGVGVVMAITGMILLNL